MQTRMVTLKPLLALILIAAVVGYGVYVTTGTSLAECQDKIQKEWRSPDGKYIAAFFERNCGATTDYSSIVALRLSAEPFDADNDQRVLLLRGRCDIGVRWRDGAVELSHPESCEVFQRAEYWKGIRILLITV